MSTAPAFIAMSLAGVDAQKFLQGQVTLHVERLEESTTRYTGICNLKGRLQFGLWLTKLNPESFVIVTTQDQAQELAQHIKKFGAFSKMTLETVGEVYPTLTADTTVFGETPTDVAAWQRAAIEAGQAWLNKTNLGEFQPQELRLHQRQGVHYDKGCYLGQEVVARLWFKAKPKHWLHLVQGQGTAPETATQLHNDVQVVNAVDTADGYVALVVAKPESLTELGLTVLDLPEYLNGDVARPQA